MTLRLAGAIARAEIRPSRFALLAAAFGAAGALVGLASQPSGPYGLLSEPVRSLFYLGPVIMAAAALLAVRPAESGLARELFLSGIESTRRRLATAIVAVGAATVAWVGALLLSAALVLPWLLGHGRAITLVERGAGSVPWWAAIGVASVALLALVGCACGCLCRSRTSALALVALLGGVPLLAVLFGEFPPALWLKSTLPTGALTGALEAYDDVRGSPLFRWGVPCAYLLGATWVVATGHRASDPGARSAVERRSDTKWEAQGALASARCGRLTAAAPVVLLLACAVLLGGVVPQRLAKTIPWWLHGTWVSDLARDRASGPVDRAYVSAVLSGDAARERRLVQGTREDALDPVLRLRLVRARRLVRLDYLYDEVTRPGTVVAMLGGRGNGFEVKICNVRTRAGWRVARVSSGGLC